MTDDARYVVPISGRAAFLLARMLKPDDVERRLDAAGFRGSRQAERTREEVVTAVELLRERGEAWQAAQRGEEQVESPVSRSLSRESRDMDGGRQSPPMFLNAITHQDAAEILGLSPQRVGQLRDSEELYGWRDEENGGRWLYDRDEVRGLAEQRAEERAT